MNAMPPPIHVLLIDDNAADNYLHQIVLEKHEVETCVTVCESAERGRQAITSLDSKSLVLLDINMPSVTGWEFVASLDLRSTDFQSIIIVVLTTSINPQDRARADHIPAIKAFYEKPLSAEVLTEIFSKFFSEPRDQ